jgi:hypothetical protein
MREDVISPTHAMGGLSRDQRTNVIRIGLKYVRDSSRFYSSLKAITGSTRDALRAGR